MSAPHPTDTKDWRCRGCGCTDTCACMGGCTWVDVELCSACIQKDLPAPAPLPLLRVGAADWHALPEAVLPTDDIGGGVTHDIYSATMYLSVERSSSTIGRELPAYVAIPQKSLAQAVYALQRAADSINRTLHDKQTAQLIQEATHAEITNALQLLERGE